MNNLFCCCFCVAARAARRPVLLNKGREFKCRQGQRAQGRVIYATQRGASAKTMQNAHSGAPALRRKAATSDLFSSMAHLRGVLPLLQGSAWGWEHSSARAHGGHIRRTCPSRRRPIWRGPGVLQLLCDPNEQTCVGGSIHSCSGRRETAKGRQVCDGGGDDVGH